MRLIRFELIFFLTLLEQFVLAGKEEAAGNDKNFENIR